MSTYDEYITVEDAADILQVTIRSVNRYGSEPKDNPRLRTRKAGRRILYHRGDVETLAQDLGVANTPRQKPPSLELLPPGEYLKHLEKKDEQIAMLQQQVSQMAMTIGRLQGELESSRYLLEDQQRMRQRLQELEDERARLLRELEQRGRDK
jgi:hypothetical protein